MCTSFNPAFPRVSIYLELMRVRNEVCTRLETVLLAIHNGNISYGIFIKWKSQQPLIRSQVCCRALHTVLYHYVNFQTHKTILYIICGYLYMYYRYKSINQSHTKSIIVIALEEGNIRDMNFKVFLLKLQTVSSCSYQVVVIWCCTLYFSLKQFKVKHFKVFLSKFACSKFW